MTKARNAKEDKIWISIRINDTFLNINDEIYDVYVLMNAVTAHVFGHVLAKANQPPLEKDVSVLFLKAFESQGAWPAKLIIPDSYKARKVFKKIAERYQLNLESVPLSELSPVIGPLMESFAEDAEQD